MGDFAIICMWSFLLCKILFLTVVPQLCHGALRWVTNPCKPLTNQIPNFGLEFLFVFPHIFCKVLEIFDFFLFEFNVMISCGFGTPKLGPRPRLPRIYEMLWGTHRRVFAAVGTVQRNVFFGTLCTTSTQNSLGWECVFFCGRGIRFPNWHGTHGRKRKLFHGKAGMKKFIWSGFIFPLVLHGRLIQENGIHWLPPF